MRRCGPALIVTVASIVMLSGAVHAAEYGDAGRGAEVAGKLCVNCHALPDGNQEQAGDAAPAFASLAKRETITEEALQTTLTAPHGPMPVDALTRQERADVIAYLLSLKDN